jgi:hypothetical protein
VLLNKKYPTTIKILSLFQDGSMDVWVGGQMGGRIYDI